MLPRRRFEIRRRRRVVSELYNCRGFDPHAVILATQAYSYKEIGRILLVDKETVSGWATLYQAQELDALKNHPGRGGEYRQRFLSAAQIAELTPTLTAEAMPGTEVGSGWPARAIRELMRERYEVSYSESGVRKLLCELGWSYQLGRKPHIRRSVEEQARIVLDTEEILAKYAASQEPIVPLAGDRSKL